jgi:hypothetical protein
VASSTLEKLVRWAQTPSWLPQCGLRSGEQENLVEGPCPAIPGSTRPGLTFPLSVAQKPFPGPGAAPADTQSAGKKPGSYAADPVRRIS